jgi:hypothetical protein
MSQQETRALQAYSLKLTLSNGRHVALPQTLLTPVQAASIVDDLRILARESGLEIVEVELCPISSDGRDQIIEQARSIFACELPPKSARSFQTAVKCSVCQTSIPVDEALSSAPQADDFLNGEPIPGDSRCELCPRHSMENCYECRAELFSISHDRNFVCTACRQRSREQVT